MSTIKKNPMIQSASGMVGDTVVFRKIRGKLQMANVPGKRDGKVSAQQEAIQKRFRRASRYAKMQVDNPAFQGMYAERIAGKNHSAYLVAMNDFLNPPTVESINVVRYRGAVGDPVVVIAADDFMVTQLMVIITDAAGTIIEQGDAVASEVQADSWEYKATAANPVLAGTKIQAIAYDRPGNSATLEVVL